MAKLVLAGTPLAGPVHIWPLYWRVWDRLFGAPGSSRTCRAQCSTLGWQQVVIRQGYLFNPLLAEMSSVCGYCHGYVGNRSRHSQIQINIKCCTDAMSYHVVTAHEDGGIGWTSYYVVPVGPWGTGSRSRKLWCLVWILEAMPARNGGKYMWCPP